MRRLLAACLLLPALAHAAPTGWLAQQPLSEASPRVDGEEFSRRLLSPIAADDLSRFLTSGGRRLAPEPFAPGAESVDAYVPPAAPAAGYGLVVFVPAGPDFALPRDWKAALDRHGLIFVALRDAGNDADVIGRRIPLVLHAHHWAADRYRLDPRRVYVSGFSGGARLAQRVAMAWPDLFTGSLQFAGSGVVGTYRLSPPPAELMAEFQAGTRVVMVSGTLDGRNRRNDEAAAEGLAALCVASVHRRVPARLDHWVPAGRDFAKALALLETPPPDPAALAGCRETLRARIAAEIASAAAAAASGDRDRAVELLVGVDDRYGGLAAPESVALARRILAERGASSD